MIPNLDLAFFSFNKRSRIDTETSRGMLELGPSLFMTKFENESSLSILEATQSSDSALEAKRSRQSPSSVPDLSIRPRDFWLARSSKSIERNLEFSLEDMIRSEYFSWPWSLPS